MKQWLRTVWRYIRAVTEYFRDGNGVQHAATIAYFGLLSVVPFIILVATIVTKLTDGNPFDDGGATPLEQTLESMEVALPGIQTHASELFQSFANLDTSLNVVSIVILLFGASAGFNAMQSGVNAILHTRKSRHFLLVRLVFAGVVAVTAGSIFLWQVICSWVSTWMSAASVQIPPWLDEGGWLFQLLGMAFVAVGYYLLLKVLATQRYARAYRWVGAFSFAILFRVARFGLDTYMSHVTTMELIYGGAVAFVGLILWLYIASVILLVSSAIVRATANLMKGQFSDPAPSKTV
jgi:membrane protein